LEEEIKGLVNQSAVTPHGANGKIFSELETAVERKISTESSEERLYWYKSLPIMFEKFMYLQKKFTA
jgi:hypothetical protein